MQKYVGWWNFLLNLFIFQDGFAVPEDDGDDLPPQPVEEY